MSEHDKLLADLAALRALPEFPFGGPVFESDLCEHNEFGEPIDFGWGRPAREVIAACVNFVCEHAAHIEAQAAEIARLREEANSAWKAYDALKSAGAQCCKSMRDQLDAARASDEKGSAQFSLLQVCSSKWRELSSALQRTPNHSAAREALLMCAQDIDTAIDAMRGGAE